MFGFSVCQKFTVPGGELIIKCHRTHVRRILMRVFEEYTNKNATQNAPLSPIAMVRRIPFALMDLAQLEYEEWDVSVLKSGTANEPYLHISINCEHEVVASLTYKYAGEGDSKEQTDRCFHTLLRILAKPYRMRDYIHPGDTYQILSNQGKGIVQFFITPRTDIHNVPDGKPVWVSLSYNPTHASIKEFYWIYTTRLRRFFKGISDYQTTIKYCKKITT